MTRRIDGAPSDDQQDTDLFPRVEQTAAMPVVDADWYRPDPAEIAPAEHTPARPGGHRAPRRTWVSWWLLAPAAVAAGFCVAIVVALQPGGTVREPVHPPVTPVLSAPPARVSGSPTVPPSHRAAPRRRFVPAVPAPAHTSRRPSASPRASVSASPHPHKPSPTATPAPTPTVPTQTPQASGATNRSSKEKPCPA